MELVEINQLEDLARYESLWNALLPETPGASFFHSYAWFAAYWRHFGGDQKMRVCVVLGPEGALGIVPLVIRRESTRIGPVRVLTYPLHDWGSFYAPLGPRPDVALQAALQHIRSTPREWDLLDLRWTPGPEADRARTAQTMHNCGLEPQCGIWNQTVQIDLTPGWDEYWAARSSKFRNNIRRFERRLSELGELSYQRYRPLGAAANDGDPRWDLFDTCVALAESSWQGSSTTGTTISHASINAFLRDAHEEAARYGALDINLLSIGKQPVAFAYNYHYRGCVYGLRIGFNAQVAKSGAGNLLYARTIEDCCRRGDHTYDLGPGSLEAKRQLLSRIADSCRYTYFPPLAIRAQALRLKRWWTQQQQPASLNDLTASD